VTNFWVNAIVNQASEEKIVIVVNRTITAFHRTDALNAIRVTHPEVYAILKLVDVFVHQILLARTVNIALLTLGVTML
jgi:hypothetical protein